MTARILVVDDSRVMQSIVQAYLADVGAELIMSSSAEEALERFQDGGASVVVSDVNMGGMDGIELCRRLKQACGDRVKVILMSSGQGEIGTDAYSVGHADAFLAKPIDGARLNRLVRTFLDPAQAPANEQSEAPAPRIRVLAADDTRVGRRILERLLSSDPELELVGMAQDGHEAVELAQTERPHMVVMDALMPGLDGIEATRRIMQRAPARIVIVTDAYASRGAQIAFEATRVGALEFLPKPSWTDPSGDEAAAFLGRLKELAEVPVVRRSSRTSILPSPSRRVERPAQTPIDTVALCASTGGPRVLAQLLPALAPGLAHASVLIVQHVLSGFDAQLTKWLRETTGLPVQLATDGARLRPGMVLLAPDGSQMLLANREEVRLNSRPGGHGHRPSGDPLFESVAQYYGRSCLGVILTGMGEDGVRGLRSLRRAGGTILAQAPASCVVPGMPEAAIAEGLADEILAPDALGLRIAELVTTRG